MNMISLKPRLSEKAYDQSQTGTYTFDVPSNANKQSVAEAVANQYDVTVEVVNITNVKGKTKRTFVSRRGKFVRGQRTDIKKAFVRLKKGDSIPIFAAEEEAEAKQEKVQQKVEKAMAKQVEKEQKPSRRLGLGRRAPARTSVRGDK